MKTILLWFFGDVVKASFVQNDDAENGLKNGKKMENLKMILFAWIDGAT